MGEQAARSGRDGVAAAQAGGDGGAGGFASGPGLVALDGTQALVEHFTLEKRGVKLPEFFVADEGEASFAREGRGLLRLFSGH